MADFLVPKVSFQQAVRFCRQAGARAQPVQSHRIWRITAAAVTARSGVAAIEFAIIAPLLILMLTGAVELGLAVRTMMHVQSAAGAGAHYAMVNGWDSAGIATIVAESTPGAGISATPAPAVAYGCPQGSGISAASSTTICSDGLLARRFVTVSAASTRSSVFGARFGLPEVLRASVTVQIP